VPGRERGGAEAVGERDHRVEPELAVAGDAGVRGATGRVAAEEAVDNGPTKRRRQIEGEVGHRERVGERAGADHGLRRAAALRAVGASIGPQLQRHRDDLGPTVGLAKRRDRRVDAAAEGDEDALADRRAGGQRRSGGRRG
jgi:hypothetical protein